MKSLVLKSQAQEYLCWRGKKSRRQHHERPPRIHEQSVVHIIINYNQQPPNKSNLVQIFPCCLQRITNAWVRRKHHSTATIISYSFWTKKMTKRQFRGPNTTNHHKYIYMEETDTEKDLAHWGIQYMEVTEQDQCFVIFCWRHRPFNRARMIARTILPCWTSVSFEHGDVSSTRVSMLW